MKKTENAEELIQRLYQDDILMNEYRVSGTFSYWIDDEEHLRTVSFLQDAHSEKQAAQSALKELVPYNDLATIGQVANAYAAQNVFTDYQGRIAPNTLRRQGNDLTLFSNYLLEAGVRIAVVDLMEKPEAWEGITYGLVDGFRRWLLQKGYAIGSVNVRLSTVKVYCKLVAKAGILPASEHALIKAVESYSHTDGRNIDKQRDPTRTGAKKAAPVSISRDQAAQLKSQPNTLQGKRDALLMCLLLDHGLRCGELAQIKPEHISGGTLVFYREKVDKTQTHKLTPDTLQALTRYLEVCQPIEYLLIGSRKGGHMQGGMSTRAITERVMYLGKKVGLQGLSAHDCRHYWATSAVRGGTDIKSLQDAGGWNSPAMPLRYVESNAIANEGVKLG